MFHLKKIIIATANKGKARDFKKLLEPLGFVIETLADYPDLPEVIETGYTFEENARLKAETISKSLQLPVLADDSGLMIEVLHGQPGVFSARFAGEDKNDSANNAKVLAMLGEIQPENRQARFHCTLVLAHPEKDSLVVEGEVEGQIAKFPRGENGFGYDPLFYYPELDKTFGEMTDEEKNTISHRARALEKLESQIEAWFN